MSADKGAKHNAVLGTKGKQVSRSTGYKRPEKTTCITEQMPHWAPCLDLKAARPAVIGGIESLKEVSWINVFGRPHSAMCSHILHNPAKRGHCKCPLNESPSIRRLTKVRCDKKLQWVLTLFVHQHTHDVPYVPLTPAFDCGIFV